MSGVRSTRLDPSQITGSSPTPHFSRRSDPVRVGVLRRDAGRRPGRRVGGGAERRRPQGRVRSRHHHGEARGVHQRGGSPEERLDVQAGGKGDVHGRGGEHQSHRLHRGHQRLRLPVLPGRGREEPAEVHRQPSQDHQDVGAAGGRGGPPGRPGEGHHGRLVQRTEDGHDGRVRGRRHRDLLHAGRARVLHQGDQQREEEPRHRALPGAGRRENPVLHTVEPDRSGPD